MKKTLQEVVWDIEKWSDETFGKGQRTIPILHHLKKEVPELIEAIEKHTPPLQINDKEYKDLMKVLYPKDNSKKFRR
jgi:hypothetical protein